MQVIRKYIAPILQNQMGRQRENEKEPEIIE